MEINKVINGDCNNVMEEIEDNFIDLIVTDPPYIIDAGTHCRTSRINLNKYNDEDFIKITNGFDIDKTFNEFNRILKKFNLFCFCSNKQLSEIIKWGEDKGFYTTVLIWHKYNSVPFANGVWKQDIEFCVHIREEGAYFEGGADLKQKVWKGAIVTKQVHPTEKPIALIEKYILIGSKEGDLILDPFLGSGTTAIVSKKLKRNYIGIETEEKYCKIAENRLKQQVLF